jgi:hypothetical protein
LILSLAACEHASNATSPSTLPAESTPTEAEPAVPAPATPEANAAAATPAPATPGAALVAPKPAPATPGDALVAPKPAPATKPVVPGARPSLVGDDCHRYRATRAAPKWNANCERPRVTRKPAPAADTAPAAQPEAAQP